MEAMRESWTDGRLDDLSRRMDERFDRVDERFERIDERFERLEGEVQTQRAEMRAGFSALDTRLDGMQRTMLQGFIAMAGASLAGFGGLAALIATQL